MYENVNFVSENSFAKQILHGFLPVTWKECTVTYMDFFLIISHVYIATTL